MPSQAAAPRLQTRLPSSSARMVRVFRVQGAAILRDRRSAITMAAAATDVAASKAPNVQAATVDASHVKAAFVAAGLSQDAVNHILKQYPPYLRWDVEQRLLPAIQNWQQELGARFVSEVARLPVLLLMKPEEEFLKKQYLASIGIKSPEKIRKRSPNSFIQPLTSMQSKVAFLQHWGFTRAQTLSLIEKQPYLLIRTSEYLGKLLTVIADMFDCADRQALCDVILSCNCMTLFSQSVETLHCNFTYFCACVEVNHKQTRRAWKQGVFVNSPVELDARLISIAEQLSATTDEAKCMLRSAPHLAKFIPETLEMHLTQLHDLGLSHDQVKSMCLRQPTLLGLDYSSKLQTDKWVFLTQVVRLSHDAIAARPYLLTLSLPNRLGPRWEYLQQLQLRGEIVSIVSISNVMKMTDAQFRAAYTRPQLSVYDGCFQKQWQQKWDSLLVDQQLSVQYIADNPDLLRIPLKARSPETLLPCPTVGNV